jgi:hypothetical protein
MIYFAYGRSTIIVMFPKAVIEYVVFVSFGVEVSH